MRTKLCLCAFGLCVFSSGCHLFGLAAHNLVHETAQCTESQVSVIRNRAQAKAAWREVREAHADQAYSADYAGGFKAGFADYLDAGGNGSPPALPPKQYWTARYSTPQGQRAIADWFAGFGHGAAAAQASRAWQASAVPSLVIDREVILSAEHPAPAPKDSLWSPIPEPEWSYPGKVGPPLDRKRTAALGPPDEAGEIFESSDGRHWTRIQ